MSPEYLVDQICSICGKTYQIKYATTLERKRHGTPSVCTQCMPEYKKARAAEARSNWSDEKKAEISKKKSESVKKMWDNMSETDRDSRSQKVRESILQLPEEARKDRITNLNSKRKDWMKTLTREQIHEISDKRQKTIKDNFNKLSDDEKAFKIAQRRKNRSAASLLAWQNMPEESLQNISRGVANANRNRTSEQRAAQGQKLHEQALNRTPAEKYHRSQLYKDAYQKAVADGRIDIEEQKNKGKNLSKYNHYNHHNAKRDDTSFSKYFENAIAALYPSDIKYVKEYKTTVGKYSHQWDFAFFINDELKLLIDLDGTYYHADNCDYDGIYREMIRDIFRFKSTPPNVLYWIINESNEMKDRGIKEILEILHMNINEFNNYQLKHCKPFPYIKYSDQILHKTWNELLKLTKTDISVDNRYGDKLILHFHDEIWMRNIDGYPSPHYAFANHDIMIQLIESHEIFINHINPNKILPALYASELVPCVPIISAGKCKAILTKYAQSYDIVFDPFARFGGMMLGALSVNKRYIGIDEHETDVIANEKMVKYLGLKDLVDLRAISPMDYSGTYDLLCTHVPMKQFSQYTDIPIVSCDDWIDICLHNFKCKRYIFITDDTKKFSEYIVEKYKTISPIIPEEKIIIIDRTD